MVVDRPYDDRQVVAIDLIELQRDSYSALPQVRRSDS